MASKCQLNILTISPVPKLGIGPLLVGLSGPPNASHFSLLLTFCHATDLWPTMKMFWIKTNVYWDQVANSSPNTDSATSHRRQVSGVFTSVQADLTHETRQGVSIALGMIFRFRAVGRTMKWPDWIRGIGSGRSLFKESWIWSHQEAFKELNSCPWKLIKN